MISSGSASLDRTSQSLLLILTFSFFFFGLFILSPPDSYAAQVSLSWDPSTSPDVAGYNVHYGTASRSYQFTSDAGNNTATTILNLQGGVTYYFSATAYNTSGIESGYSNEISYTPPSACTYSISPTSQSQGPSGGPGTVSVTATSGCTWTAVSNAFWITITSNSSLTGNGTVSYSVSANSGPTSRAGTMTIGRNTFTVTQSMSSLATCNSIFSDVACNNWALSYIQPLYTAGIITGCGNGDYCPSEDVTRGQMATLIIRGLNEEPPDGYCGTTTPFPDVSFASLDCKNIKKLSELGITTGYGDGRFAPGHTVTREQMAVFLTRSLNQVPADGYCGTTNPFTDVPHERWSCKYVKKLSDLGLTAGYGDGRFGPEDSVTRAQMAVFLARAFLGI